ncbi:MAG TPA: FtsW/RodA/SpoVE family cell cycle protein [Patescibacteria group bacterium]|nr:FtsW/RodA/SpoVE family cell cycle protein [Patescibacteria group bacterium]
MQLKTFRNFDWWLFMSAYLLIFFGLSMMYSLAKSAFDMGLFYQHLANIGIGTAALLFLSGLSYHKTSLSSRFIYIVLVILLIYLLVFTREIRGSSRWIDFGFFNFQPAEFMKLILALVLGRLLWFARGSINMPLKILQSLALAGLPAALIILQPDLGSSLILLGCWISLLMISPMRKHYLIYFFIVSIILCGLSWKFLLRDFQRHRIEVFLDPSLDPRGRGYNVSQAIIAVGSGGLTGKGLGEGYQSRLKFLPERQTDFIFATSAEEVGLIGSLIIISLYGIMLYRLRVIALHAKDHLGYYTVCGFFFIITLEIAINVGMNIGILPVTGIPLPLFSYGGSAMLSTLMMLGVAQNVAFESKAFKY